ncbi:LysM peptidoglycan-binding domain-containing protein [Bacillus licheniformis]|uniref:LysM peptidoglycan-binding domain-containing protein n=1 Tax=Bacillus subtilis group TaxID=653685 RepID=UPI0011EC984C|nr:MULTISPECIES: LysM peptidoglycan-binding domain-containing protein [Bacillus subtilis group]KAA0817055.1 LysM peptidoglycan-binding domain-containing protein [Bacillus licheniformis]KAA0829954.1 LysM peptidoglycan-binding domain-containing protein [Bacillus licheniformis]KAA0835310.1 LysM peptidoglycan-binding domain-containing protein [Bacillus paralicheniformis]KAA0844466.1 LysM peptidoglycan-binding domain-containing protein [Bacillus licheniformis]
MAEFETIGGEHSSKPSSKKFKLNKKNIIIFGGVGIAVFLLVAAISRGRGETEERVTSEALEGDYLDGNPMNSAMVQGQLSNNQSIIENSVETALNNFANELGYNQSVFRDSVTETITDIGKENKAYADKVKSDMSKQLSDLTKKMTAIDAKNTDLQNQLKKATAKPAPAKTSTPAKKPAPAPAKKSTPAKKAPAAKYKTVTVKKGDTLSELTQKYGKGGSKAHYMEAAKLNKLKNANKIYVGQKLKIPVK